MQKVIYIANLFIICQYSLLSILGVKRLGAVSFPSDGILDHRHIIRPTCPNMGRDVLKIVGRVVLVRDLTGPSGLVRVVFGSSCP